MTALPTNSGPGAMPLHLQFLLNGGPNVPTLPRTPSGQEVMMRGKSTVRRELGLPPGTPLPGTEQANKTLFGRVDSFLNSPGGMFAANLLSQSGYSPIPDSPIGAFGRALVTTNQQRQDQERFDLERALIESQIGVNQARANPSASNNIGAVDPSKFTPESLAQFQQTQDFGVLKPIQGDGADLAKLMNELADDARTESGDFVTQNEAFKRIEVAASNPSAFSDLALIFAFMKVQDPGSTVREGEFANAQNTGGVPQRVRALYNNVLNGARLDASQREDLLRTSQRLFNSAAEGQQKRNERFRARGRNVGLTDALIDPLLVDAQTVNVLAEPETDKPTLDIPDERPTALQPGAVILGEDDAG